MHPMACPGKWQSSRGCSRPVAWHVPVPPWRVLPGGPCLPAACQGKQAATAEHPARAGLLKGVPRLSGSGTHGWDRLRHGSSPRTA